MVKIILYDIFLKQRIALIKEKTEKMLYVRCY